jgi:hypothetical protein
MKAIDIYRRRVSERLGRCAWCDKQAVCANCSGCLTCHSLRYANCNGGRQEPMVFSYEELGMTPETDKLTGALTGRVIDRWTGDTYDA